MFAITSPAQIKALKKRKAVTCCLLADGYYSMATEFILKSWDQIHKDSGDHWHVCVPFKPEIDISNKKFELQDISDTLSIKIGSENGIHKSDFPCIIFDDFRKKSKNKYITLSGVSELYLRDFFQQTAEFINHSYQSTGSEPSPSEIIGQVYRREQFRRVLNWKVAGTAFSLVTGVAGLS